MIIIAEKINGTRKAVSAAIRDRDAELIQRLAKAQTEAGSHFLDVNAGTPPEREPEDMAWLVETVQQASELPLALDSANAEALKAGIEVASRTPMINSVSGEAPRINNILPIAMEHKTPLILLGLDDEVGIAPTAAGRLAIIERLVALALAGGLEEDQLFIDPLVTAISTGTDAAQVTFETIRGIRQKYPKAHVTCGLSNISFGLPERKLVNQTFMAMAIQAGLDSAIVNPNDRKMVGTILAAEMLLGQDKFCQAYSRAYRAGRIGPKK